MRHTDPRSFSQEPIGKVVGRRKGFAVIHPAESRESGVGDLRPSEGKDIKDIKDCKDIKR